MPPSPRLQIFASCRATNQEPSTPTNTWPSSKRSFSVNLYGPHKYFSIQVNSNAKFAGIITPERLSNSSLRFLEIIRPILIRLLTRIIFSTVPLQHADVAQSLCSQLQVSIQSSTSGNHTQWGYAELSAALNQIRPVLAGVEDG